jgi:hypothetical protein
VLSEFDREEGAWAKRGAVGVFNVPIPPADAVVLRFEKTKPGTKAVEIIGEPPAKWNPAEHFTRIARLLRDESTDQDDRTHAVYSTPTARTADNKDKPPGLPAGKKPFPNDFWLEVKQGEALAGFFKLKNGADVVCLANANRYAWQGMLIVPRQDPEKPTMIWELQQESGQWVELGAWGDVNFPIPPAGSAVFKFKR